MSAHPCLTNPGGNRSSDGCGKCRTAQCISIQASPAAMPISTHRATAAMRDMT